MVYKKAIRDKIPDIIKDSGYSCNIEKLSDTDFLKEMEKKLDEELAEYKENGSVEELADMIEVIMRISELQGCSMNDFEKIRRNKAKKRGTFKKIYFLLIRQRIDFFIRNFV